MNHYVSYCCGEPIRTNEFGSYCTRCKREVTKYGNPVTPEERKKRQRRLNGLHCSLPMGADVLADGSLVLKVQENYQKFVKAEFQDVVLSGQRYRSFIVADVNDNYVTSVTVDLGVCSIREFYDIMSMYLYTAIPLDEFMESSQCEGVAFVDNLRDTNRIRDYLIQYCGRRYKN